MKNAYVVGLVYSAISVIVLAAIYEGLSSYDSKLAVESLNAEIVDLNVVRYTSHGMILTYAHLWLAFKVAKGHREVIQIATPHTTGIVDYKVGDFHPIRVVTYNGEYYALATSSTPPSSAGVTTLLIGILLLGGGIAGISELIAPTIRPSPVETFILCETCQGRLSKLGQ